MNKKKKIIIIGVCIIAAILGVIIVDARKYYNGRFTRDLQKNNFNEIKYIEFNHANGSICIVEDKYGCGTPLSFQIYGDKYVFMKDYDYVMDLFGGRYGWTGEVRKINKADVNIYNLETRELIKTIDLKKIMKKDMPSYEFGRMTSVIERKGEPPLLCLRIIGDICPNEFAYIDLETEEVVAILSTEEVGDYGSGIVKENELYLLVRELIEEDEIGILGANNLHFLSEEIDPDIADFSYLKIRVPKESVPTGDIRLYQEFPGLKDYEMEEDESLYICLDTAKSGPKELIELFLEEGQEISFEGCVLPAESSVDGKEHEINSFEDYYQWKNQDYFEDYYQQEKEN